MLYIVSTPIGNLQDITMRAISVLKSVDVIVCEDSKKTNILLNHFGIKKKLMILNDFNEESVSPTIFQKLEQQKDIALISDAGTPLISDPGYRLVKESVKRGIKTTSIPGPTAAIAALTLSGLPPDKFLFLGFLPKSEGKKKSSLEKTKEILTIAKDKKISPTVILYESPHRLIATLKQIEQIFGNIKIAIAKELTKIHENVTLDYVENEIKRLEKEQIKGEYVILFNLADSS